MIRILIVEDDTSIAGLIKMSLEKSGYHCVCDADGAAAATRIERERFDLILLDVMLPGIDGFSLFEYIREYEIPVIFITARTDVADRVKGLRMGADDYIIKPFDLTELNARVDTVLRRYHKKERYIHIKDVTVDTDSHTVTRGGVPVELTHKEYELLLLFARNRGIALYREIIYERVWEESWFGDTRTVDLHVLRLRKKLGLSKEIQSVYKVGYRLCAEDKPV